MAAGKQKDPAQGFKRTREDHQTEQAEDYVELVAELIAEKGEARTVEMARRLGVSHVTVNRTLGRLQKTGLIVTEPYREIELTPAGRKLAESCAERHEIVRNFLLAIGVPHAIAEADTEGIEHHVSPQTLKRFAQLTLSLKKMK